MEITEQQFNANLQNLSEMDQQNVIGIIQEIDGDELRSFAKALGVDIVMSEEVAEEPMDAAVDPAMDEMPMEEPPMEAPPAPVQPSMDQQMQQLAMGDQVVEPVPEEAMPTEAMPTEAMPTEAVPMEAAPVDAVAGPIMQDGASETGVADDVPMDAEEGAYVVNAAAIERVGVRDFEERILKPNIESLRKKGVEISLEQLKSPAAQVEGDTDVAVSNGEYYLPPVLVKEIGLDLLEKINKRGEQETEERIAEEEAPVDPMQQQVQALKKGQRVKKNIKTYNNPGNVERTEKWAGMIRNTGYGENQRFAIFDSPVMGVRAVMRDITTKINNHNGNIKNIISKYAPTGKAKQGYGKENPNLEKYIKYVQNKIGKKNKVTLKDMPNIVKGIIEFENKKYGKEFINKYTEDKVFNEALELSKIDLPESISLKKARKLVATPLPPEKPIPQSTLMQIPLSDTSKKEEIPFK